MPTDNTSPNSSRWSQLLTILFAFVLVVSFAGAPLATGTATATTSTTDTSPSLASLTTTTTTSNASYYDDFEDGTAPDWNSTATFNITNDSFYGNHSIYQNDTQANGFDEQVIWEGGPTFNTTDNFEISGTYKAQPDTNNDRKVILGLLDNESGGGSISDYKGAMINHDFGEGKIFLATQYDDAPSGYTVGNTTENTWMDFRLQVDSGTARLKVWESGSEQPDGWQAEREYDAFDAKFFMYPGQTGDGREIWLDQVDAGGNAITGQVVDQSGSPVPNATVGGVGVNYESINDTISDKEQEAEELLEKARDVGLPEGWQSFSSEYGTDNRLDTDAYTNGIDSTYPLVHQENDWGSGSTTLLSDEVGTPRLQANPEKEVVISLWDASQEPGPISLPQGPIDGSHPGAVTEGTIVLEQYGPANGVVNTETIDTKPEYYTKQVARAEQEYHAVKRSLPVGLYRVYPEGNPERGYWFMVGDAQDQWNALETQLKNEAGQLTEHAQELRNNVETGLFERRTTTTNATGHFTLRMQTGVQKATVQAFRADGTVLTDITGPSFADLRNAAEDGTYNGTYYVGAPSTHAVPKDSVTIETYRTDQLPYQKPQSWADLQQWLQNQQLNETIAELQSEYDKRFEEMNRSVLERTYKSHKALVTTVPGAKDRYLKRSDFDSVQDASDLSDDELATETNHMQVALAGVGEVQPPDPGENPVTIEDGQLHAEYPIPSGVNTDTLQPEIHWSDGTSEQIGDDYWSIESGSGLTGKNTLVIDGYPINSSDPAAFDIRILGGGEDGILDDRISALNPSFEGTIPDVRAIDLNTLAPGESESVSMTFRTSDGSSFKRVASLEVFGPDGTELSSTIVNDYEARFETSGAGKHFVRATITDTTGSTFVQTFTVRALEQGRNDPPTVRAETAVGDRLFAVVGDGLDDARIKRTDSGLEVDAIVPGGEIPGSIHVKPQPAMEGDETTIDVRVLEGNDEATLATNVATVIHLDSLPDSARVWRGEPGWFGQPLSWDGGTRYGEVMQRGGEDSDKVVIRTYTDGNGQASVTIDSRDGLSGQWADAQHGFASTVPRPNIPFVGGMAVPAGGGVAVAGVFVWFSRRRRTLW